ncbi:MAG TPA: glycosyltransferase family 39 protein [Polyangiaceae bacterium]|nr:glycosyltransferase family 39 protein [Polyangiaceae bacterium]
MQRAVRAFLGGAREWVRGGRWLSLLVAAGLLLFAVASMERWIGVAVRRVGFQFDLEWMEGDVVTHVALARQGQNLYRAPSFDFTPLIYPPLYYYVSALVSSFVGVSYLGPRLVSLCSMLGSLVLVARWVREETDDALAGLVAAGALSATYGITGFWFDIARVDSLFVLLVLAAQVLAARAEGPRRAILVGVLLAASALGKQTALFLAVSAIVPLLFRRFRLGLIAGASFAVVLGLAIGVFQATSRGWFWFYYITLPSQHEVAWAGASAALEKYFWGPVAPMTLAAIALVCGVGLRPGDFRAWAQNALFVLSATAASLASILHTGGYPNVLMPAYTAFAIAFGVEVAALRRLGPVYPAAPVLAGLATWALAVVSHYDPARAVPTRADAFAGARVLARMKQLEKPLWVTTSTYYAARAGQQVPCSPTMGIVDVLKGGGPLAVRLHAEFQDEIRRHRFKTIVMDRAAGFLPLDMIDFIRRNYRFKERMFSPLDHALWPKSGAEVRPDEIWVAE